jgi:hypothetical protein
MERGSVLPILEKWGSGESVAFTKRTVQYCNYQYRAQIPLWIGTIPLDWQIFSEHFPKTFTVIF